MENARYNLTKEISFVLFLLISVLVLILLTEGIEFDTSNPINDTTTTNTTLEFNVSITNTTNLKEVIWNWNGTNTTIMDGSLVLMMNFDNVSSLGENDTSFLDFSGYENNGTGESFEIDEIIDGKYGKAVNLDGINDFIKIDNEGNFDFADNFTFLAWINTTDDSATYHVMVNKLSIADNGLIWALNSGKVQFYNGASWKSNSSQGVADGNWHLLGIVVDSGICRYYFDGLEDNTDTGCLSALSNVNVHIGRILSATPFYFNGTIDEIRIWNKTLTASEIEQLYMSNLNKYDIDNWSLYVNQSKNATQGLDNATGYTYYAWASDDNGNSNRTEIRTISVGITDSCTYSGSGNWDIDCSDNCIISDSYNIDGNLTTTGSGTLTINKLLNFTSSNQFIKINPICEVRINKEGGFG